MKRKLSHVALLACTLLPFFAPAAALADAAPAPNLYVSPDQISPGQQTNLTVEIKNTTPHVIDSITLTLANDSMHLLQATAKINNGADIAYSYYDSNNEDRFDFGAFSGKLNLKTGDTFIATIGVNVLAIGTPPTTVGAWNIHMYHWDLGGNLTNDDQPIGNTPFVVTNDPHPSPRPLNFGTDNQYSKGLNGTGITDPSLVQGLFPPGPIDSLILLPVNVMQEMVSAANGGYLAPTTSFFGRTITYPNGQAFYNGLGSTVTFLISSGLSFIITFVWLKSLYMRLQRATMVDSHPNDTWGLL